MSTQRTCDWCDVTETSGDDGWATLQRWGKSTPSIERDLCPLCTVKVFAMIDREDVQMMAKALLT